MYVEKYLYIIIRISGFYSIDEYKVNIYNLFLCIRFIRK